MIVKRVRVEEGFFDGLDANFNNGLNVLIGGRGVGKTSIIELIRFALGANEFVQSSKSESIAHALAVLDTGRVTVDLQIEGSPETLKVSRSYKDDSPQSISGFKKPIIFSQKEIESVGLDSIGRLAVIDTFLHSESELPNSRLAKAVIRSQSATISELRSDIEELRDKIPNLKALKDQEARLQKSQDALVGEDKAIKSDQERLRAVQNGIREFSIKMDNLALVSESLLKWKSSLEALRMPIRLRVSDSDAAVSLDEEIHNGLAEDFEQINRLIEKTGNYLDSVTKAVDDLRKDREPLEEEARQLRQKIDGFNEGVGKLSKELNSVRDEIAGAENLISQIEKMNSDLMNAYTKCNEQLESITTSRNLKFEERKAVIASLNEKLSPLIEVKILHLARIDEYEKNLKAALAGSGLKYNEVSGIVASNISPQELLELVVNKDFEEFSKLLNIPLDRATRLMSHLMVTDLGDVLVSVVEDDVQFFLQDGTKSKSISELSIGQRCTVALSIILENKRSVLLIDQPEDHLDNEFVANTLIKAIKQRGEDSQTIISSHNANIPVLGDAARVTVLDSNGRSGFINYSDSLTCPEIVSAIEKTMEGGKEAFSERATFYSAN